MTMFCYNLSCVVKLFSEEITLKYIIYFSVHLTVHFSHISNTREVIMKWHLKMSLSPTWMGKLIEFNLNLKKFCLVINHMQLGVRGRSHREHQFTLVYVLLKHIISIICTIFQKYARVYFFFTSAPNDWWISGKVLSSFTVSHGICHRQQKLYYLASLSLRLLHKLYTLY